VRTPHSRFAQEEPVTSLKRFLLPLVGSALALVGVASLTVSSGRAQPTRQPATAESAYQAAVVAQVATAGSHMTAAGYHDMAVAIEGGQIPAGALGRIRRARIVIAATQWPEPLRGQARALVEESQHLEALLPGEDLAAIGPPMDELHETGDAFIGAVYNWLATAPSGQGQP